MANKNKPGHKPKKEPIILVEFPREVKLPNDFWTIIQELRGIFYKAERLDQAYLSTGIKPPLTINFSCENYHKRYLELQEKYDDFYGTKLSGAKDPAAESHNIVDDTQLVSIVIDAIDLKTGIASFYRDAVAEMQREAELFNSMEILADQKAKRREESVPELVEGLSFELFDIHHSPYPYVTYILQDAFGKSKEPKVLRRHKVRDYESEISRLVERYKLSVSMRRSAREIKIRTRHTKAMIKLTYVLVVLTIILVVLTILMLFESPQVQPIIYHFSA